MGPTLNKLTLCHILTHWGIKVKYSDLAYTVDANLVSKRALGCLVTLFFGTV